MGDINTEFSLRNFVSTGKTGLPNTSIFVTPYTAIITCVSARLSYTDLQGYNIRLTHFRVHNWLKRCSFRTKHYAILFRNCVRICYGIRHCVRLTYLPRMPYTVPSLNHALRKCSDTVQTFLYNALWKTLHNTATNISKYWSVRTVLKYEFRL